MFLTNTKVSKIQLSKMAQLRGFLDFLGETPLTTGAHVIKEGVKNV